MLSNMIKSNEQNSDACKQSVREFRENLSAFIYLEKYVARLEAAALITAKTLDLRTAGAKA